MQLSVQYMPVDALLPYEHNSKKHPDAQIDQIAASIEQFGNCDPIAIWHDENLNPIIVEGHGRVLALKKLGIDTAPVISLDHLSDDERRMYSHVHNQTTLSSGLDYDILLADIEEMEEPFELESLGFTIPNIDEFGEDFEIPDNDSPHYKHVALDMTVEQYELFTRVMEKIENPDDGGNRAANKVCEVFRQWEAR